MAKTDVMVIYPTSTTSPQYEAAWLNDQGILQVKRIGSYTVLTRFRQRHPAHTLLASKPADVSAYLARLQVTQ